MAVMIKLQHIESVCCESRIFLIDIFHHYATAEVSVLGHYQHDTIKAIKDAICSIQQGLPFSIDNISVCSIRVVQWCSGS